MMKKQERKQIKWLIGGIFINILLAIILGALIGGAAVSGALGVIGVCAYRLWMIVNKANKANDGE